MHRRTLLGRVGAAGLAGLAGCASGAYAPRRGFDGLQRRVRLAGQDTVPDHLSIDIEVALLEATITGSHTARLQITTTNHGPSRALSVDTGGCDLLNRQRGGSDEPPGLWLYAAEDAVHIDRDGKQWVATRPRGFFAYGCLPTHFATGDSVTNEYVLWHDLEYSGYLEPGTYRWEEPVEVWGEGATLRDQPEETFTWGFSLAIEMPE